MTKLTRLLVATGLLLVIIASAFGAGALWGYRSSPAVPPVGVDFSPFWKTWQLVNDNFVNANATTSVLATATTSEARVWGAISGMVDALGDPYTTFFPPPENKIFNDEIQGNFGGIGIEIGVRNNFLTVIAPLKGTPADLAGMKAGDKIVEINGQTVSALAVNDAINLIRGEIGTAVKIKVTRGASNLPHEFNVVRAQIDVPTVESKSLPGGIFLISLYNFGATSPNLFRDALRQFVGTNDSKLIIDLRGNPGGYLEAAVDMASWFLPAGKVVAVEDHGVGKEQKLYRSKGYDVFDNKLKLAILVDGGSASASEIFAGALHEYGLATLVGEKTFGKGSVQELISVTDDTSLKVTIARWLTPHGVSISHNGLTPDVVVAAGDDPSQDPQLDKAIATLKKS